MTGAAQAILSAGSAATGPPVNISDQSLSLVGNGFGSTSTGYRLDPGGNVYQTKSPGTNSVLESWLLLGRPASDFEVRGTFQGGDFLTSGTLSSWLSLSTLQQWVLSASAHHTKACTLLIEIRDATSLTVLDSATIAISVDGG